MREATIKSELADLAETQATGWFAHGSSQANMTKLRAEEKELRWGPGDG